MSFNGIPSLLRAGAAEFRPLVQLGLGQLSAAVITLGALRLYTTLLNPSEYGLAALGLAGAALLQAIVSGPVLAYDLRRVTAHDAVTPGGTLGLKESGHLLACGGFVILIGATVSIGMLAAGNDRPLVAPAATCLGLGMALQGLGRNRLGLVRTRSRLARLLPIQALLPPLGVLGVMAAGVGRAEGLLLGQAVGIASGGLLPFALGWVGRRTRDPTPTTVGASGAVPGRFLTYALPLAFVGGLAWTGNLGDRFVISAMLDNHEVGIYAAGYAIASQPFIMLGTVLTWVHRPILFRAWDRSRMGETSGVASTWRSQALLLGLAGLTLVTALRETLASLFLAPEFAGASAIIPLVAMAYLFQALGQPGENWHLAAHRSGHLLPAAICGAVVALGGAILAIPRIGVIGAAGSTAAGLGLQAAMVSWGATRTRPSPRGESQGASSGFL